MPGPDPISPLGRAKADEDHDLPTTSRMQSLLMEQEARIKLHFDQAIEKLLVSQVGILDPVVRTPSQRSQSQTPRRRNQNVQNNQYKAGAVPTYVRKMVEGTVKSSAGLGNSNLRSGSLANSWSSEQQHLLRQRIWLAYDMFTMFVIFLYACIMGVNLQITTLHSKEPDWTNGVELVFCALFSVDLVVRIVVERFDFFRGPMKWWNFLDSVLVSMMIASQVTQATLISSFSGLRVLRLLRVLRIMRLAKYFARWPQFRQVRILLASIAESLKMMIWLLLIAFSIIYVFSLVITEGVWQSCEDAGAEKVDLLCRKFGTLSGSMITLYQILYNGVLWGDLWDEMIGWSWFFLTAYLVYVAFSVVILGNMMASFLFSLQEKVSKKEKENMIQSEIESKEEFVKQMNSVFCEFDANGNGAISWTEFQIALEDPRMHAFLSSLELDISDAIGLFSVLDSDGTGAIEHSEFLFGCLRLRGGAKAVDMVRVQMEQEWMHNATINMKTMMQEIMKLTQLSAVSKSKGTEPVRLEAGASEISFPEVSEIVGGTSQILPYYYDDLRAEEYRTELLSEERAVTLQELKRISSDALLASRHGWDDPRTGARISSNELNLYHFSYYHILPKTAPRQGILLQVQPLSPVSPISSWRALCGQQILQGRADLPSGVGTILRAHHEADGSVTICVSLKQGRFSSNEELGNIMLGDMELGKVSRIDSHDSFSYKEYLSSAPCLPAWYCSHWWGEPIVSFVNCCQKHSSLRRLNDASANYWVCGYANRQHELELEIGRDITESSFYKALNVADGLLLILDQDATPFSRIWCDYELYASITAPDKMLDIVTMAQLPGKSQAGAQMLSKSPLPGESAVAKSVREQSFPLSLLLQGLQVCLEKGEATIQKDKDGILFEMGSHADLTTGAGQELLQQNLKRANDALHSTFAILAWPQAMQRGTLLDFGKNAKGSVFGKQKLKLPEILAMDDAREVLELSLAHFEDTCLDSAVKILASGLPSRGLKDLRLSFEGCNRITDQSLTALGSHFCQGLRKLYLDFIGWVKLTDTGLSAIAAGLPSSLEDLELHFAGCPGITSSGLGVLRDRMPKSVQTFCGTFKGTGISRNFPNLEEFLAFTG